MENIFTGSPHRLSRDYRHMLHQSLQFHFRRTRFTGTSSWAVFPRPFSPVLVSDLSAFLLPFITVLLLNTDSSQTNGSSLITGFSSFNFVVLDFGFLSNTFLTFGFSSNSFLTFGFFSNSFLTSFSSLT